MSGAAHIYELEGEGNSGHRWPLVTIAIPTFNRPELLREAVASALAQSYRNIEVVIGDNAGSDTVRGWCEALREHDRRVRYVSYGRNVGMAGNWNALAERAEGEFFALLADDDRMEPSFVESLLGALQHYQADFAFSNHYVIDDQGNRLAPETRAFAEQYCRAALHAGIVNDPEALVWKNSISIAACLIRTDDVRRLRFKEDLNTPELEFFVRFSREGHRFVFLPEYLSEYRIHSASGTAVGLWIDRLADYLIATPIRSDLEPLKRQLLRPLLVTAVNRCLERGDRAGARRFLASTYYPRPKWKHPQGIVQTLCLVVPSSIGRSLLRVSRSAYRRSAGIS